MTEAEVDAILITPPGHASARVEIISAAVAAVDIVRDFAARHGWQSYAAEPFFRAVEIYRTQGELWRRILEINNAENTPMPTDALTAALENGVLMAVVREEAERARPEYFRTQDDWMRALAHEMIHRLHVRILKGDEEAMGPQWFYEGFAVLGSGQPLWRDQQVDTMEQALALTQYSGRGAYARYASALRFFAARIPLQQIVAKAGAADFEDWLRKAFAGKDAGSDCLPDSVRS